MKTVLGILAALLVFGFLIVTHEGGHFLFARIFGVKVNEFSVGMGPKLFGIQGKETLYTLRLFPIGGFCAMEGESEDSTDERAFDTRTPWQRAIIIVAGALINLLTGILLVAIMLATSDLVGTPEVKQFAPDAITSSQGLKEGDRIYAINGHKILTTYDLSYYLMKDQDGILDLTVLRDGKYFNLESLKMQQMEFEGKEYAVCDFAIKGIPPTIGSVAKYSILDSISIARIVWDGVVSLATGQLSLEDMSGPVGIVSLLADTTEDAVKTTDFSTLLYLMSLLAINLGVFNLIPFPALDGGRFWLIAYEGITGKRFPVQVEGFLNFIGLSALLLLMVMVTMSDISKFF